ncbi:MAG: imidazole glycerol phosphate synthase subunit HisH [Syntrophomonadaceae bacterium]
MIIIIDYGMGNLASVQNALRKLGYDSVISSQPGEVLKASKVILPGVGAFEDAMNNLAASGLDEALKEVAAREVPLLGICLGMQLLCDESEENGLHQGLKLVPGRVTRFRLPAQYKVPHMGWNEIESASGSRLFAGIIPRSHFYFVHSYHVNPLELQYVGACCEYGYNFVCALEHNNLFATQFHPEKSGQLGLRVLNNFACM